MKTILKFWVLLIFFIAEILLGIYTYFHSENLFLRFLFFTLTTIIVAMLIIKMANDDEIYDRESFTEKDEHIAE